MVRYLFSVLIRPIHPPTELHLHNGTDLQHKSLALASVMAHTIAVLVNGRHCEDSLLNNTQSVSVI